MAQMPALIFQTKSFFIRRISLSSSDFGEVTRVQVHSKTHCSFFILFFIYRTSVYKSIHTRATLSWVHYNDTLCRDHKHWGGERAENELFIPLFYCYETDTANGLTQYGILKVTKLELKKINHPSAALTYILKTTKKKMHLIT